MKDFFLCFKRVEEGRELQNVLEARGYTVGLFSDSVEMLEAFAEKGCRAFFLDASIEEGILFTKIMAIINNIAPDVPTIVSSDDTSLEKERKIRAQNVFFYFTRPIPDSELIEIATNALKKSDQSAVGSAKVGKTVSSGKGTPRRRIGAEKDEDNEA